MYRRLGSLFLLFVMLFGNFSVIVSAFDDYRSADFVLDYGGVVTGAGYSESPDFLLKAGNLPAEVNSSSNDFQLRTINLLPVASLCGNGVIDGGEVCDGGNLNGESCQSQGFDGGALACNAGCSAFVVAACFNDAPNNPPNPGNGDGGGAAAIIIPVEEEEDNGGARLPVDDEEDVDDEELDFGGEELLDAVESSELSVESVESVFVPVDDGGSVVAPFVGEVDVVDGEEESDSDVVEFGDAPLSNRLLAEDGTPIDVTVETVNGDGINLVNQVDWRFTFRNVVELFVWVMMVVFDLFVSVLGILVV